MIRDLPDSFATEFRQALADSFDANLSFAFVFGSFAKGYGADGHDIDTFVCLHRKIRGCEAKYLSWLNETHKRLGLKIDADYPAEILAEDHLERMLDHLPHLRLCLTGNSAQVFDYVVWSQILSDEKKFVVGDCEKLSRYKVACSGFPLKWKSDVIRMLKEEGEEHLAALCQENQPLYSLRKAVSFSGAPKRLSGDGC